MTSSGISFEAYPSRVTTFIVAFVSAFFFMAFSAFAFLLAFARERCLALAITATSALLGGMK